MKLTMQDSEKIKQYLPKNWVQLIGDETEWVVGDTMIRKVVNGDVEDKHDIIKIAIRIAEEEKSKQAQIKEQLNNL